MGKLRQAASRVYWSIRDRSRLLNPRRLYHYNLKGRLFDLWYGVETNGIVPVHRLGEVVGPNRDHAVRYQATSVGFLGHVLRQLDVDLSRFQLIDFGSGKGRVLLMATAFDFRRIIGVEFSRELHAEAQRVVGAFLDKTGRGGNIELACMDATAFEIPDGPCVLYFYNPFQGAAMQAILRNIERAQEKQRRPLFVIYCGPTDAELFDRSPLFSRLLEGRYGPDSFVVYGPSTGESAEAEKRGLRLRQEI